MRLKQRRRRRKVIAASACIQLSDSKVRIHCETWSSMYMRMEGLGVLFETPVDAYEYFSKAGFSIRERIMSGDGNRLWTLSKKQKRQA